MYFFTSFNETSFSTRPNINDLILCFSNYSNINRSFACLNNEESFFYFEVIHKFIIYYL